MKLPEDDEAFLNSLGCPWRLEADGTKGNMCLIIENFDVSGGDFAPAETALMIRIPALYNTARLDMWYCDPPILKEGKNPPAADARPTHVGRSWQRFSRHLPDGSWLPGKDGLRSFFTFIFAELQGRP